MAGTKFSVFGLGDKSFAHFCGGAKRLDALMEANGAERFVQTYHVTIGEYYENFFKWVGELFKALKGLGSIEEIPDIEELE